MQLVLLPITNLPRAYSSSGFASGTTRTLNPEGYSNLNPKLQQKPQNATASKPSALNHKP